MLETGDETSFPEEALAKRGVGGDRPEDDLHGHDALERFVLGPEDLGHAADARLLEEAVASEYGSGGDGHGRSGENTGVVSHDLPTLQHLRTRRENRYVYAAGAAFARDLDRHQPRPAEDLQLRLRLLRGDRPPRDRSTGAPAIAPEDRVARELAEELRVPRSFTGEATGATPCGTSPSRATASLGSEGSPARARPLRRPGRLGLSGRAIRPHHERLRPRAGGNARGARPLRGEGRLTDQARCGHRRVLPAHLQDRGAARPHPRESG